MTKQLRQRRKLPLTPPSKAVIHLLLMHRRAEMLIERPQRPEPAMAQVTLECSAVPSGVGGCVGGVGGGVPGQEVVGDGAAGVEAVDGVVDGFSVEIGGAGAGG